MATAKKKGAKKRRTVTAKLREEIADLSAALTTARIQRDSALVNLNAIGDALREALGLGELEYRVGELEARLDEKEGF